MPPCTHNRHQGFRGAAQDRSAWRGRSDIGSDIVDDLDTSTAGRPLKEQGRINVDLPASMVESLSHEAGRLEVTRHSIIEARIVERLEHKAR